MGSSIDKKSKCPLTAGDNTSRTFWRNLTYLVSRTRSGNICCNQDPFESCPADQTRETLMNWKVQHQFSTSDCI